MTDISEQPIPRRSRTWSFYFVLLFAVLPVFFFVPLAWCFAVYSIYTYQWTTNSALWNAFFFVSCCEVIFSIFHYYLAYRVSCAPAFVVSEPEDVRIAYIRLLKAGLANISTDGAKLETLLADRPPNPLAGSPIAQLDRHDPTAIAFRYSLRNWFCKVPFSSIRRHHVEKWLYWTMYNSMLPPPDQIPPDRKTALDDAVVLLQRRIGFDLPEGSNDQVRPILLTVDDANILWRPLTFYVVVGVINWCVIRSYTTFLNVQRSHSNGIEYLIRNPANWDFATSPRPVVFLHGLGLGLLQYHPFILFLFKHLPDRPILIPLQPQISQDIFHPNFLKPFSRREMEVRLAGLLKELGWVELSDDDSETVSPGSKGYNGFSQAELEAIEEEVLVDAAFSGQRGITMISHSNGTYTHAWMLKSHPGLIGRSCFIDPVTFCSWEGDVCYNFLYRPCMTGMELILRYFVGTELGVANLLHRHFCWTSNSLWAEDIPNARDPHKTFVVLGGKDNIVNAERVKLYLNSHGLRENLWCDPEGHHGQPFIPGSPALHTILRWLSENETK